MNPTETSQLQQIRQQIDRLIVEVVALRQQVLALEGAADTPQDSVRQADYFGMWADRPDIQGRSSREWLEDLRRQQWSR